MKELEQKVYHFSDSEVPQILDFLLEHKLIDLKKFKRAEEAKQVAQVLFTLPYSFSNLGMLSGILLQIIYGLIGSWTAYLISVLYIKFQSRKEKVNVSYKNHIIQENIKFHDKSKSITGTCSKPEITSHLSIELRILGVVWIGNRSDHWHIHLYIGLLVGLNMGRIS
ncbi:hypothetical protein RJ639_022964 [Escallonia herrerae]|uniref:Amino acid transporter transmembrane domain-containing protein n=1 Tax=Escallonia herrerae TaxID=1293975 RepID=A0AA88V1V4_9ASTE|nr:hypothetical protein RJ639_022964 [Escallonia herrerae]